jgi:hypothetical protein
MLGRQVGCNICKITQHRASHAPKPSDIYVKNHRRHKKEMELGLPSARHHDFNQKEDSTRYPLGHGGVERVTLVPLSLRWCSSLVVLWRRAFTFGWKSSRCLHLCTSCSKPASSKCKESQTIYVPRLSNCSLVTSIDGCGGQVVTEVGSVWQITGWITCCHLVTGGKLPSEDRGAMTPLCTKSFEPEVEWLSLIVDGSSPSPR